MSRAALHHHPGDLCIYSSAELYELMVIKYGWPVRR